MAFRDCGFPITIILATSEGPVAVCINKIDKEIFKENSPVLTEIYRCLDSSHGACSFSQALTAAYNIRCSQQEQESILIAITNAHFNQIESDAVVTCLSYLQLVKTYSIGVGVGISPIMISKVFNRSIWSGNPLKIGNCFMKLSELDTNKVITEGKITNPYPLNKYSIEDIYNMFINNNRKYFTELTIGLDDIKMYDAAADHYMIEGTDLVHLPTEEENEYGPYQGEIPEVDLGRNKKWNYNILICQLYDFTCNSMDVTKETSNAQNQQAGTQNQQAGRSNKPAWRSNQQDGTQNQQAGRSNKPAWRSNQQAWRSNKQAGTQNQQAEIPEIMREDKLNQFYKVYRRNRIPDTFDVKNLYIADTYASSSSLDYNGIIEELYKLGFHVEVAQNYCDCIAEITSGNYHQVWVICSKGQEAKPTNVDVCNSIKKRSGEIRGESTDFSHAYQFVESVEEFRKKGGAVSFWADQDFTFELDYYLEHLEVYDCDKVDGNPTKIPCNLRFDGSCSPKNDVLQRATPNSFKEMTFDSEEIKEYPYYDYQFYGYNVLGLYAGQTIAGVKVPGCHNYQEICERIKPFKPFSLGTDKELVTGCYYVSPKNSNESDIIIDGASSRIFRALNPEGAKRLARNMAVGLVNKARRVAEQGDYTDAEPVPAFKEPNIPIQIPIVQNKLVKPVDLTFIFDATKSAEKIKSLINYQIESAMKWLQKFQGDVRVAVIGFRNEAAAYCLNKDIEINRTDVIDFTPISKADKILDEINYNFSYEGGIGDGPKDWNSAFEAYLNLNFRKDSTKITFFIPGDGTHHPDFHKKPSNDSTVDFDNYKFDGEKMTQQQRLDDHIRRLVKQEAYWVLCGFNSNAIDPLKTLLKNMNNTKVSFITLKECSSTPNLDPLINISDEKLERIYENILIKTSSLPTMFDI